VRIKLKINLKMTQVRIPSSVMVIVRVGFTVVALDYHEINSTPLVRETHPSTAPNVAYTQWKKSPLS
jgi:hypothetical protein